MEESDELVEIKLNKVTQSSSYTCVILGNDEKRFAIYTTPEIGKLMQSTLASAPMERPFTHDLISRIFQGLEIRLKQIVINKLEDTTYFARLFLEQQIAEQTRIVEIDARPSDCITLALSHRVPLYCTRAVLEETIAYAE